MRFSLLQNVFLSIFCTFTLAENAASASKRFLFQEFNKPQTSNKSFGDMDVPMKPMPAVGDVYTLSYSNYKSTWEDFKKAFNRQYETVEEEQRRYSIFMENVNFIEWHNWRFHNNQTTFYLDTNQFSDMTDEEFGLFNDGLKRNLKRHGASSLQCGDYHPKSKVVPGSLDWRSQGLVTPVKNDGHCGATWAFSATAAIESQWKKLKGQTLLFSEQQLIDCSQSFGNKGCVGGTPDNAFRYIVSCGGLETKQAYHYEGQESRCRFNKSLVAAEIHGCADVVPHGSEEDLKIAVGNIGPISISFDSSGQAFKHYKGGVYDNPSCSSTNLNFAALVVGYGSQGGKDYWIVKNSWGTTWGDKGYIYMSRNKGNQCGVATEAGFPIV